MILIVIISSKIRTSGSLMKMLLLITLYVLKMYLNLSILVPCTCLYPSWKGIHIENNEGSVFIVPLTKREQSPIIFCRSQARATTSKELDDDLEPPQFFHYAWSAHRMMKKMGYSLNHGDGLNFDKRRSIPLQPFVLEGKSANYYDRTRKGSGYVTSHPQSESESNGFLQS